MGWAIILAICYVPIVYRIHRRLHFLEEEVSRLRDEIASKKNDDDSTL